VLCCISRETAEALTAALEREAGLTSSLADLRGEVEAWDAREAALRSERAHLESRVRELETANQGLAASIGEATAPLLRQIESLTRMAEAQQEAARDIESRAGARVTEFQQRLAAAEEREQAALARCEAAEVAARDAERAASSAAAAASRAEASMVTERDARQALDADARRLRKGLQQALAEAEARASELQQVREQVWEAEERVRTLEAEAAQHQLEVVASSEPAATKETTAERRGVLPSSQPGAATQALHRDAGTPENVEAPQPPSSDPYEDEMDALVRSMSSSGGDLRSIGGGSIF
jgi:chromosome segregation ATPase